MHHWFGLSVDYCPTCLEPPVFPHLRVLLLSLPSVRPRCESVGGVGSNGQFELTVDVFRGLRLKCKSKGVKKKSGMVDLI